MFKETSYDNLYFTEHWPASISVIKGNFSKSFNSLCTKNMISFSNNGSINTCSNSRSSSLTSIYDSIDMMENINSSKFFSSQRSLLDIIEEE